MSLNAVIKECCDIVRDEADEFDAQDVLMCLKRNHAKEVERFAKLRADTVLLRAIKTEMKRNGSVDHMDQGEQLKLAGFDTLPQTLSFYDGERVRYISTLKAKAIHFRGAIKLREDAAVFNDVMARKFKRALELIEANGDSSTLADALHLLNEPAHE